VLPSHSCEALYKVDTLNCCAAQRRRLLTVWISDWWLCRQALGAAEDETDIQAANVARAEQKAELAEFDENIPWDEREVNAKREREEQSRVEMELALLDKEVCCLLPRCCNCQRSVVYCRLSLFVGGFVSKTKIIGKWLQLSSTLPQ